MISQKNYIEALKSLLEEGTGEVAGELPLSFPIGPLALEVTLRPALDLLKLLNNLEDIGKPVDTLAAMTTQVCDPLPLDVAVAVSQLNDYRASAIQKYFEANAKLGATLCILPNGAKAVGWLFKAAEKMKLVKTKLGDIGNAIEENLGLCVVSGELEILWRQVSVLNQPKGR